MVYPVDLAAKKVQNQCSDCFGLVNSTDNMFRSVVIYKEQNKNNKDNNSENMYSV